MEYPVNVSIRCPAELERKVRVAAARQDMNRSQFILAALRKALEELDAKSAKSTQDSAQSNNA